MSARRRVSWAGVFLIVVALLGACGPSTTSSPSAAGSEAPPPSEASRPEVAPGEPWVVYQSSTGGKDTTYLARPDGSEAHILVPDVPGLNQWHPDWSPDGLQVAFTAEGFGYKDIWVADATGANAHLFYDSPEEMPFVDHPAWSPDGTQIAVDSYDDEPTFALSTRSAIALVDVATGESEEVIVLEGSQQLVAHPRWAPSGDALVMSIGQFSEDGSTWTGEAIAISRLTDTGWSAPQVITEFADFGSYPDWHPTEDLIVFATADGGWFINIVQNSGLEVAPRPQPDLFTVRPDGSELTQVSSSGELTGDAGQPSWTPDGRIVFTMCCELAGPSLSFIGANGSGFEVVDLFATHSRLRP